MGVPPSGATMKLIVFQTLFFGCYLLFLIVVREWSHGHALRKADAERERRAALEREWRVGIPYDPRER